MIEIYLLVFLETFSDPFYIEIVLVLLYNRYQKIQVFINGVGENYMSMSLYYKNPGEIRP